jgi:hypothetical protein
MITITARLFYVLILNYQQVLTICQGVDVEMSQQQNLHLEHHLVACNLASLAWIDESVKSGLSLP